MYRCCRERVRTPARERLLAAFRTNGLLVKSVSNAGGAWHDAALGAVDLSDVPVDTDCGRWCAAYSLLTPQLPIALFDVKNAYVLVHDAGPLFPRAQCAAVVDANTLDRSCCSNSAFYGTCPWYFPNCFGNDAAGYCAAGTAGSVHKALAAGCAANVHTIKDHLDEIRASPSVRATCDTDGVESGRCAVCREPQWCDDPGYLGGSHAQSPSPEKWIKRFLNPPRRVAATSGAYKGSPPEWRPGWFVQSRQCRWKPTQKETFIATARQFAQRMQSRGILEDLPVIENEVNFYVGKGDGGLGAAAMSSLRAIFLPRGLTGHWARRRAMQLAAHLRDRGLDIPVYEITIEQRRSLHLWDPAHDVDLEDASSYRLMEVSTKRRA
jgi:hypothetical protein